MEQKRIIDNEEYLISTDRSKIDPEIVHRFLSQDSYWAQNIPMSTVQRSIAGALCYGVYVKDAQIGFARVITDFSTVGYLSDVFILKEYRGKGLSKWLVETILADPELQGFRRWILVTADAHTLYEKFGFETLSKPERWMEKYNPDVYA
jgi:GNAT superfamily N-acetyltransferase